MKSRELLSSEILLSDEQLKAIGCLAVESSRLELLLDDFIQTICRFTDMQTDFFIGKWMTGAKMDALKLLIRPKLQTKRKLQKFDALFERLKDLIVRRNIIIHGEWTIAQPYNALAVLISGIGRRSDAIANSKKKKLSIKATDVMTVALRISECRDELFRFFYHEIVLKRLRASLRKSPC